MNISEFARDRGLKPTTVSLYIRRHANEFDGHTRPSGTGNSLELDDIALEILDKKYPRKEQPVQILEHDPELERKIAAQNELIIQLQAQIISLTEKNSHLEHELGEVKQSQLMLEIAENEKKAAEEKAQEYKQQYESEKNKATEVTNKVTELTTKLEYETQRTAEIDTQLTNISEQLELAEERAAKAEKEASSYVKSWFGFFRKKQ